MCRDNDHGGRRCPHDTSAARQARRLKARARAEYSTGEAAKGSVTLITSTAPATPAVSVERVRELQAEIKALDEARSQLPQQLRNEDGSYSYGVGGEIYATMAEAIPAADRLLEQKTVEAGSIIAALAAERSGVAPDAMQSYWTGETERLKGILDADQKVALTPEQQAEMDAALGIIANHSAELEAFYAAHADDYPHEYHTSFYPRLRAHLRDHPEDETAKALDAQHDELLTKHEKAQQTRRRLEQAQRAHLTDARERYSALNSEYGRTEAHLAEMMQRRAEAYREVLAEVRQLGGAELKVADDSHKKSVKVLAAALRYYPTEWIEASNRAVETSKRPLRIKHTTARAHYTDGAYQKKSSRMPSITSRIETVADGGEWQPDPNYVHDHGAFAIKPPEGGGYTRYELPNGYSYEAYCEANEVLVIRPDYEVEHEYNAGYTPRGRGWQRLVTKAKHWRTGEEYESVSWVRQRSRVYASTRQVTAELTVSGSRTGFQNEDGFTVALHEFAHRVESTGDERISRIEATFLERRRKASEGDGNKDSLTRIYNSRKREVGYEDEFTSRYMGKVYPGSRHKELLSTGMEALFGGSYGGLAGTAGMRRDDDHAHLILGLLATA